MVTVDCAYPSSVAALEKFPISAILINVFTFRSSIIPPPVYFLIIVSGNLPEVNIIVSYCSLFLISHITFFNFTNR